MSVVGLGCWQLGADWGEVTDSDALAVLHAALDEGVTLLDTADVYGDGRSEVLIGRLLAERGTGQVLVATKMGRRADPHVADAYVAGVLDRLPAGPRDFSHTQSLVDAGREATAQWLSVRLAVAD